MAAEFFIAQKLVRGISYAEYTDRTKIKLLSANLNALTQDEKEKLDYSRLNLQRSLRIEKNYTVSEKLKSLISAIQSDQNWMVITEDWCGDSAQTLPYIAKMAECNPRINLRIVFRDSNPEIMDQYLTNGTQSIPKLVAFDKDGLEVFQWGPRPKETQELFKKLRFQDIPKESIYEQLQQWYTKNRGQAIEKEFIEIIGSLNEQA